MSVKLPCFYHPDREAATKCEKCGKMLCVACKMVETVKHSRSSSSTSSDDPFSTTVTWETKHDLCPECYYDRRINQKPGQGIMMIIIGVILGSILISVYPRFKSFDFPGFDFFVIGPILMGIISVLLIVSGVYSIAVKLPRNKKEARVKKQEFFESVAINSGESSSIDVDVSIVKPIAEIRKGNSRATKICPQCGSENPSSNQFCGECGSRID